MLLLLLACKTSPTDSDPTEPPLETVLTEPGPWGTGYREQSLTYNAAGSPRTLRMAVWYPTEDEAGGLYKYFGVFDAPGVVPGATVASGPFPLITYSHGHQGYAEASARIVNRLVSHGYIVVAPDHTNNTFLDGSDRDTEIFWQRSTDISAVLDEVLAAAHFVNGSISNDPIVGMGHSFGGYTMHGLAGATYDIDGQVAACQIDPEPDFCSTLTEANQSILRSGLRDERIAAAMSMAPGNIDLWGASGLADIDVPVLLMTGGLDNPTLAAAHWDGLRRAGNTHVNITNAGHNAFSDVAGGLDIGPEFIVPEDAWDVIGAYALGFVRNQHGDEATAPLFTGALVIGDTTEITTP